ncbi:MAG TPA: hypothetical protein VMS17_08465 [Gemmataceae bacterium]|nr:hypothetical protein [Gemmataceae bacterium]
MSDSPPSADSPPPNGDGAPEGDAPESAAPPPAAKPTARRTAARPWQGGRFRSTAGRGRKPSARMRTIVILSVLALILVGAIAAWIFYPRTFSQPYFLPLIVDQYNDPNEPAAAWGEQDRAALTGRGWQAPNTVDDQERRLLVEELTRLGSEKSTEQPVVVYLRAFALPTEKGDLAVLPLNASLDDATGWLPLRDVFQMIKACHAPKRLVLLDVMQPTAGVRNGIWTEDAAELAQAVLKNVQQDDPNLFVLCACSPGQTSLASEEMGHTVFVHYLIEGLSGKAASSRDNPVTVRELAAYVTANVDAWAWHNRGVHQTPVFIGPAEGGDFPLTTADAASADKETPLDKEYPAALQAAWELRDGWLKDAGVWTPPALYRRVEDAALRAETRYRAGFAAADVQAELTKEIESVKEQRKKAPGAAGLGEPDSLALADALHRPPPANPEQALDTLVHLANLHAKPDAKPEQLKAETDAFLKQHENQPFELSWLVYQAAKAHPETRPEELRFWLSLLHPEGRPVPDYAEIHLLERLSRVELPQPKDAPELGGAAQDWKEAAASALKLADAAEGAGAAWALLPPLPDALMDYFDKWRQEAAGRRRAAEALLLKKPLDLRAAQAALEAVRTDAPGFMGRGYAELRGDLDRLGTAIRCRDEAFRLVPGFAENGGPVGTWSQTMPQQGAAWKNLVEQEEKTARLARDFADRLSDTTNLSPQWFRETQTQTETLQEALDTLMDAVSSRRLRSLIGQRDRAGGADAGEMEAALRLPAWSSADRRALWQAWRDVAGRLNEESSTAPAGPLGGAEPTAGGPATDAEDGVLRARAAFALLTLAGGADATKGLEVPKQAPHTAEEKAALRALGRELRKRLAHPPAPH